MSEAPESASETSLRAAIAAAMQTMHSLGLNRGTAGNASARFGGGLLISPSGVRTQQLDEDSIVFVANPRSEDPTAHAGHRPSSEWRLHQAVFDARSDIHAIVHCHSRFATVLACARKPIPAVHYLVGLCGAIEVPVARYARFGSPELAEHTVHALTSSNACLLANHGLIACATTIEEALTLAEEMEEQAAVYWHTLAIGGGEPLAHGEMHGVLDALHIYGGGKPTTPAT